MQKTEQFEFELIESSDNFSPDPINRNIQKAETLIAGRAQCAVGRYVGTGTYGPGAPNSLTLPFVPQLLILTSERTGTYATGNVLVRGQTSSAGMGFNGTSSSIYSMIVEWSENTVTWYSTGNADKQFNTANWAYRWFALG